jgi:hypothetical protein
MSSILFLSVVLVFYFFLFGSFAKANGSIFAICLILIAFFYDYVFINLSYTLSPSIVFVLKSWQEFLLFLTFIFLGSHLIIKGKIRISQENYLFFLVFMLSVYGVVVGIISSNGIFKVFLSWRSYALTIFLLMLVSKANRFQGVSYSLLRSFILCVGVIVVVIGIFQHNSFDGNLSTLWFYRYFENIERGSIDSSYFNFIRDGTLRTTSVFVSPLIYSMVVGMVFLLAFFSVIFEKKRIIKLFYLFLCLFFSYGLAIANARIGIVMLLVGIACGLVVLCFPRIKFPFLFIIPIAGILATIIMMVMGVINDLSALGRLRQYLEFFELFNLIGYGFGDYRTMTFYDSWYISVFLLFGVMSIGYIYLHYLLFKSLYLTLLHSKGSTSETIIKYSTLSFGFSFVYIFAFQYTIGGPALFVFYLLMQMVSNNEKRLVIHLK